MFVGAVVVFDCVARAVGTDPRLQFLEDLIPQMVHISTVAAGSSDPQDECIQRVDKDSGSVQCMN